jgi:hypothetical protein
MNKDVCIKDGGLYFGSRRVVGLEIKEGDAIPKLYVIRVKLDDGYPRFVCGMDLCEDKIWLGANESRLQDSNRCSLSLPSALYDTFSRVEWVLNNFVADTYGKEWEIHEEEDLSDLGGMWDDYDYDSNQWGSLLDE